MKNDFVLTTTPTIEGCAIKRYIDVVNINIVLGTNLFSDFGASLTDIFGGQSDTYQNKLVKMYGLAKERIVEEAKAKKANAAVNFSIDFDEISGKNKSMFMLTVTATVVTADLSAYADEEQNTRDLPAVPWEKLSLEIKKRRILAYVSKGECVRNEDLDFLMKNPFNEFVDALIYTYSKNRCDEDMSNELLCLSKFDKKLVSKKLYHLFIKFKDEEISKFIEDYNLLDTEAFLQVLQEHSTDLEAKVVLVNLLKANSDTYLYKDLENMIQILSVYKEFPDKGSIQMVKGGLSRKEKEVYICPNGHKNDKDTAYCYTCLLNIKGLSQDQGFILKDLQDRVDALKAMFEEK